MAAAELKLQVGLDLAFFRQQLAQLGSVAVGYHMPINIKFSPIVVQQELSRLKKNIGKTQYTINIKTNLENEIKNADRLVKALQRVQRESGSGRSGLPVDIRQLRKTKSQGGFSAADIKTLFNAAIEGGLLDDKTLGKTREQMVTAFASIGKDSIEGLLNGLSSAEVSIRTAAESIGATLITTTKASLGMRSPSKKFEEIGKNVGKGFENGVLSSMDAAFNALERKMQQRMAVLDTIARGVFHMLGMDPAAMMAAERQKRLPPAQRQLPPAYRGIGPSAGPAGLLPPAYRGIGPSAQPLGLLPPAYRGIGPSRNAGALPSAYRGLPFGFDFRGLPSKSDAMNEAGRLGPTVQQMRQQRLSSLGIKESQVRDISGTFDIVGDFNSGQKAASQRRLNEAVADFVKGLEDITRRAILRGRVRQVNVSDLGRTISNQAMLPGRTQAPLMLPAAGGTTPRSQMPLHSVSTSSNLNIPFIAPNIGGRQINRGVGAMGAGPGIAGRGMAPPSFQKGFGSPEALAIENAAKQTLRLGLATDVAQRNLGKMNASQIPFIGGLRGIAGELGQATKQVLLYGTAYKALAAITSIPGQILDAAKSQQQYTNGLKVATQETGTFAKELLFVDNVQRAFGLNLETTRTGFTRLYASMAPTGFDSGSIEKLFTGISAATAALQLTPDKAERVIYAFGQMASKGQIMSEELKGQLGDVLPGALAIFAKSAGMSVKEFSKAMEDGVFTGDKFREVFAKVSDELMTRFGTGAQAAGKSLQGLISTVGGDFKRTLESFAPLANAAAQATLGPLTGMLREVSMAAQIAMGEQDRVKKQLEDSRKDVSDLRAGGASAKDIKAAETNVAALAAKYEVLNEAAKDPAIARQVKNIESFVAEVQKAATFTMNLAGVIGNVLNPFIAVLGGNFTSVIGNLILLVLGFNAAKLAALLFTGTLSAMRAVEGITRGGAVGATLMAGAFRLLGVQATSAQIATGAFGLTLKGLLISTGIGAVVVLLGSLAAAFLSVGNRAKQAADRAQQSIDSMTDAARTGNVSLIEMNLSVNKADQKDLDNLIAKVEKLQARGAGRAGGSVALTPELQREAKRLGAEVASAANKDALLTSLKELREPLKKEAASGAQDLIAAQKRAKLLGLNKPTPDPATKVDDDAKKANLESYYKLGDDLSKLRTAADIERATAVFDFQADRVNALYDMQEARANSFQKASIQFQREMFNIEVQRQKANLDAQNQITKAQGSVAGGGSTAGAYLQGDIGPTSTGPHFDVKKVGGGYFDRKFLDQYVQVNGKPLSSGTTVGGGAFAAHQGRGSSGWDYAFGGGRHAATLMGGAQWLEGKPTAHGEQRRFQIPTGEQFQFLHGKSEGIGAIPPGKIAASQARTMKAELATNIAITKQHETATRADEKALLDQQVAMQKYVSSIMPIAEQELQIQLLQKRSELTKSGISQEQIDTEMQIFETRTKSGIALKDYTRLIEQYENAVTTGQIKQGFATKAIAGFRAEIDKINKGLPLTVKQINELAEAQSTLKVDTAIKELQGRLEMARALTPEAEMRVRIKQQNPKATELQLGDLFETEKATVKAEELKTQMQGVASTIGDSFGNAFKGIIDGSMTAQQALGSFFQNIGNYFVDMAARMIAEWIKVQALQGIQSILSAFSGSFGGGKESPLSDLNAPRTINNPLGFEAANGGIATGGFRAFATGGIVTGPTLGLVGEGKYNEAVIPLPDGKSVPVDLGGMSGGGAITSNIVINMNSDGQSSSNANGSNSAELGRKIEGAVKQVMVAELRPGGILAGRR